LDDKFKVLKEEKKPDNQKYSAKFGIIDQDYTLSQHVFNTVLTIQDVVLDNTKQGLEKNILKISNLKRKK
jgi:hypothetical protein